MVRFNLKTLALGLALFLPYSGFAEVRIFHADKPTEKLLVSPRLPSSVFEQSGRLNQGLAAQAFLKWVRQEKVRFGLKTVSGETLVFQRAAEEFDRISLHFKQRFNRTGIEGAELIGIFDASGELLSVNSSLVELDGTGFTVQPELSRSEGLRAAIRAGGFRDAEEGNGSRDGLLVVRALNRGKKVPYLVWQYSLREYQSGTNAAPPQEIQVYAQSSQTQAAGAVHKIRSLAHGAWSERVAPIDIYDSSLTFVVPNPYYKGILVMENGERKLASIAFPVEVAQAAHSSFARVLDFFDYHFGRRSYDGQGAVISASVNVQRLGFFDLLGQKQNAAWMGPWKMFIFGAGGDLLGNFAGALDVVGHEFTHAVIGATSDLVYEGESGALNEHLADVFGALVEEEYEPWMESLLIGESVLRGRAKKEANALRDMLHPEKGFSAQPGKVSEITDEFKPGCVPSRTNDNCGVHILSGIPNRAFAVLSAELSQQTLRDLYYRVMTQRLRSSSDFKDYRAQLMDECSLSFDSGVCERVEFALNEVEIQRD